MYYIIQCDYHDGDQSIMPMVYINKSKAISDAQAYANNAVIDDQYTVLTLSDRVLDVADIAFSAFGVKDY